MKQNIILWTAALVVTFLAGYFNSTTSSNYPISGTIGISGNRVSYKFDKQFYAHTPYKILIRTDIQGLDAVIQWKKKESAGWNQETMRDSDTALLGELPSFNITDTIQYRVKIHRPEKDYYLPGNSAVTMSFYGKVSSTISSLYFITLFAGLILSTRTGLEYFRPRGRLGTFAIFTLISFFLYTIAVTPLWNSYLLDVFKTHEVPPINQLFGIQSVLFLLLWIAGLAFAFKSRNARLNVLIISCLTLLVFIIF